MIYCRIAGTGAFHPALHAAQVVSNGRYTEAFKMKGTLSNCDVTGPIQGGTFTVSGAGHELGGAYKSSCSNVSPLGLYPLNMKAQLLIGAQEVTMLAKMRHQGIAVSDVEMNRSGATTADSAFQYPSLHIYLELDIDVATFNAACASRTGFSKFTFGQNFAYLRFGS